jgi:transposase
MHVRAAEARGKETVVDHIGIDLHKRESQIYVLCDTGEVTECRIATSRDRFTAVLGARPPAKVLLEASTESEWVATCLEGLGHEVIVADPNYAPMYGQRSRAIKTDRRDAAALAEACRIGAYRAVHRVSAAQRQVRQQLRVRESLVATRRRLIVMLRALCRGEGVPLRRGAAQHFLHRLAEVELPSSLAATFEPVVAVLRHLEEQLTVADQTITEIAARDVVVQRLMTVPGVGPVIGTAFVAALDTPARFPRARQVASYLGLVPREDSSADRRHRGRITKAGNPRMRWLLVQAAWAIRLSRHARAAPLRDWTNHIACRRGVRIAVVALARRLTGILYALWRDGTLFDARRLQPAAA